MLYVYICVYMYTYTWFMHAACLYMCIHVYIYMIYVCCMFIHMCAHTYMCIYSYAFIVILSCWCIKFKCILTTLHCTLCPMFNGLDIIGPVALSIPHLLFVDIDDFPFISCPSSMLICGWYFWILLQIWTVGFLGRTLLNVGFFFLSAF